MIAIDRFAMMPLVVPKAVIMKSAFINEKYFGIYLRVVIQKKAQKKKNNQFELILAIILSLYKANKQPIAIASILKKFRSGNFHEFG
jgi:hypothetical protein